MHAYLQMLIHVERPQRGGGGGGGGRRLSQVHQKRNPQNQHQQRRPKVAVGHDCSPHRHSAEQGQRLEARQLLQAENQEEHCQHTPGRYTNAALSTGATYFDLEFCHRFGTGSPYTRGSGSAGTASAGYGMRVRCRRMAGSRRSTGPPGRVGVPALRHLLLHGDWGFSCPVDFAGRHERHRVGSA